MKLSRELGLFQVTIAGVGIILGAGIYALLGIAAGSAGNATWLAFLISAIVALFTGLSYAELSSVFKGDAGEYDYLKSTLKKKFAFSVALSVIAAGVISAATVALGFAGYVTEIISMPLVVAAVLLIALMTLINFAGIKETSWFNTISTCIEFGGLALIIFLGWEYLGTVNYMEMPHGYKGVFSAGALVFFAFMGFESIVKLREETKDPEYVIPRALVLAVIITSIVYVLVAMAAVSVIGWEELARSSAPLAVVATVAFGGYAFIILGIIALFSTSNTVLITMVATSRMMYGMAKERSLPKILAAVHRRTRTPWVSVLLVTLFTVAFTLIGDIEFVANLTNVFLFITFASVNLSLIILRMKCKKNTAKFKCPINIGRFPVIALLGMVSSLVMLGFVIINFMG